MFKFALKPETQARLEAERREVLRLYGLTNQWLAHAVLKLVREARLITIYEPSDCNYNARLVWGLVPELARRVALVRLDTKEIDWELRSMSDRDLRIVAGYTIANASDHAGDAWSMLTRLPVHGNPVALLADRLLRGVPGDREDPLARQMTEVAGVRGTTYEGLWTPEAFLRED